MFYTYLHRRESDNKPFYIGKGQGKRAWSHKGRNTHWTRVVGKHGLKVEILAEWSCEKQAFDHEKFLIVCFRDIGFDLVNMTDGGDGASGYKHKPEHIQKISILMKGKTKENDPVVAKRSESNTGKKISAEQIAKMSERMKGVKPSSESRIKMSNSRKGKKQTQEHIDKRAEKRRGYRMSDETKVKISKAQSGKKASPETKARMSAAQLKRDRALEGPSKLIGRTKENNPITARIAKALQGRTKETHLGLQQASEKMKQSVWVNTELRTPE